MTGFNNLPGRGTGVVVGGIATGGGVGAATGGLPVTGSPVANVAFAGLLILAVGVGLVVLAAAGLRFFWSPKRDAR